MREPLRDVVKGVGRSSRENHETEIMYNTRREDDMIIVFVGLQQLWMHFLWNLLYVEPCESCEDPSDQFSRAHRACVASA